MTIENEEKQTLSPSAIVAITVVVCAVIGGVVFYKQNVEVKKELTPIVKTTDSIPDYTTRYSDKIENSRINFNSGCSEDGQNMKYCNCMFNWIIDNLGHTKFIEISLDYLETEVLPQSLKPAIKNCIGLYNY